MSHKNAEFEIQLFFEEESEFTEFHKRLSDQNKIL